MQSISTLEFLRAFPGARGLDIATTRSFLSAGVGMELLADTVLFDAGDPSECAYLLVRGEVRVERLMESGERILLARLGRGHIVGDMGLLSGKPRSATAISEVDTLALRLDRGAYLHLREQGDPGVMWLLDEIHRDMSARIATDYERMVRMEEEPELAMEPPTEPLETPGWLVRLWRRVRT
ncbi:MAG: cyclic nucleotide-binding domain-containing protein [Myxococcota bacterium]|nr:cyclic nucleotide-binding domain-containing protein [Myxococcota bacterium]